jgi:hypothetical protein
MVKGSNPARYKNSFFQRGRYEELHYIRRTPVKGGCGEEDRDLNAYMLENKLLKMNLESLEKRATKAESDLSDLKRRQAGSKKLLTNSLAWCRLLVRRNISLLSKCLKKKYHLEYLLIKKNFTMLSQVKEIERAESIYNMLNGIISNLVGYKDSRKRKLLAALEMFMDIFRADEDAKRILQLDQDSWSASNWKIFGTMSANKPKSNKVLVFDFDKQPLKPAIRKENGGFIRIIPRTSNISQ